MTETSIIKLILINIGVWLISIFSGMPIFLHSAAEYVEPILKDIGHLAATILSIYTIYKLNKKGKHEKP